MSKKLTFKKIPGVLLFALILCAQYAHGQNIETSLKKQLTKYSSQKTRLDASLKIIDLGTVSVSVPSYFKNKRTGTIKIWDPNERSSIPANFWTYVKSKKDIKDMITIVMNFQLNK